LFIQDATVSRKRYIEESVGRCKEVCEHLRSLPSEQLDPNELRLGVLSFRGHKDEHVTDYFGGFTSKVDTVVANLSWLATYASGDGDSPGALGVALDAALRMEWRSGAVKLAILITDAPPHGIGKTGDGFPYDSQGGVGRLL
jgi:hypothetical protein